MAGFSGDYKQRTSSSLIQRLNSEQQLLAAENLIKRNGLQWFSPNSSDVYIIGPNKDIVEFAIESLEGLLDKNRNPLHSLENGSTRLDFKGTLAKYIIKSQQILKEKSTFVIIYESTYNNGVTVSCNYDDYSKIRKTIDEIINSTSSTESSSLLDKNVVEGKRKYNGYPGSPSTPLYHFQHSEFKYEFKTKNIQVYVYNASITDVTGIDAIVNAADEYLCNASGVAYTISEADGYSIKKQCSEHFRKHGRIPIGQNVVTIPGNLKYLKTIIHAVGPRWDDYSEKKQCAMALHETIINVLRTANTHCVRKIAFPPISAGLFKVPKELCAMMYVKAIMDYSRDVKPNNVTEIHFVDIKDDILKAIREADENWKMSPEFLDFKNALGYASPQGGARPRTPSYSDRQAKGHHGGASYLPCEVLYCGTETMPFGVQQTMPSGIQQTMPSGVQQTMPFGGQQTMLPGVQQTMPSGVQQTMPSGVQQTIFKVKKSLTVRIYSGSIVEVSGVDALVCFVGPELRGSKLAEAFRSVGGVKYTEKIQSLKSLPHSVGDVAVILEPGNLKSKCVLLAIMESKRIKNLDENTAQKLKAMYVKILEKASAYGMKRIALTLLGSGLLVDDAANLECCCNCLFDGLTDSRVVRGICVEDIQVVNIHPKVTDAIVRVFHQRSTQNEAKSKYEGAVGEYKLSSGGTPKLKKPGLHHTQSLKLPNDYKKEGGKKEKERCASVYVPSSPGFSQDKDDSYYQVHGLQWNDSNEVKQKKRTQSSSLLFSHDQLDADNFEPSQNEKYHQKQTQGNQPVPGDGESWLGTENGGKPGNLPIYDVDADKLKTLNKCKIEKSVDTCSSNTCDKTAKESLGCGHKFCEICFIPMKINPVCTICSQKSVEMTLGASSTNPGKITKMPEASSSSDACIICMEKLDTRHKLLCGHDSFHKKCIDEAFVYKEVCPLCGKIIGTVTGSQPDGKMKITNACMEKLDTQQILPYGHVISKKSTKKPIGAKVKHRNAQLPTNTGVSVTTSVEKDTEINKLEQRLRDLEATKIEMIKAKRKKELEEKIRQAEEDLRVLSAGTKQKQSNKSSPPLSSLSIERDREEIELEQKLTELKEKKLSVLKEINKKELKEKIKQMEEELSTIEAAPSKDIQEEVIRCLFCSDVLRNPRKLGCGHEFCSQCFYQASEFQEGCPMCGIQVGDDDESQQELASDDLHSWYKSSDFIENS